MKGRTSARTRPNNQPEQSRLRFFDNWKLHLTSTQRPHKQIHRRLRRQKQTPSFPWRFHIIIIIITSICCSTFSFSFAFHKSKQPIRVGVASQQSNQSKRGQPLPAKVNSESPALPRASREPQQVFAPNHPNELPSSTPCEVKTPCQKNIT